MTYPLVGHEENFSKFRQRLQSRRLEGTFLLAGPDGIGKRLFVLHLAKCLLCEGTEADVLDACNTCTACQQVAAQSHPDLLIVSRPPDKNYLPIELLIGDREQRMRAGLRHDIALKPFRGGRRIALIDDADYLNQEGANCLLKTLEEPPPHSVIFLLTTSEHRQLSTIRSRAQTIRFQRLSVQQVQQVLEQKALLEDPQQLEAVAQASQGSVAQALFLAAPEVFAFRRKWLAQLATHDPGQSGFADSLGQFVESAGKEAALRRNRFRKVVDMAVSFFRNVMLGYSGNVADFDPATQAAFASLPERSDSDFDRTAQAIERCHRVYQEIAANANQTLVIECWLSDIGRICRGESTES